MLSKLIFPMFLLAVILSSANVCFALTPEDPEVRKLVQDGVNFLKQSPPQTNMGRKVLTALALLKAGEPRSNPKIQDAAKSVAAKIRKIIASKDIKKAIHDTEVYDVCLALVFMCELSPEQYPEEINALVYAVLKIQKPNGGWGYPTVNKGDNSMTQYAALGLWSADQNGFKVPLEAVEKLSNYIVRVQDPSGAWGYQAIDPGAGAKNRVTQSEVRASLVAASLSSLFISADFLGLTKSSRAQTIKAPVVLREVGTEEVEQIKKNGPRTNKVNVQFLERAARDGNAWMQKNARFDLPRWKFYYLYSLERFQSFKELSEGKLQKDPPWYNAGVAYLKDIQNKEKGTWSGVGESEEIATAFAVLFLVRSTGKSIQKKAKKFSDGLLIGGRGIPKDLTGAKLKDGKVIGKVEIAETTKFMALMESEDSEQLSNMLDAGVSYELNNDERGRDKQIVLLRRKVREGSFAARMMAVRTLKNANDFESVPVLIYALTDPDWRVSKEARDALRYLSRKFTGFSMPDRAKESEKLQATQAWKEWYLSVRPDAKFLD